MKKIYFLEKHPVKIGDVIEHYGFRVTVTEELVKFNPELFSIEEDSSMDLWAYIPSIEKEPFKVGTQPMYFKCVNSKSRFTLGRVYEQKDHSEYPERVSLKGDNGVVYNIKDWTSNFISKNNNCFELTTKAEWDKQELLDEAKRRYPIGTVFNSKYGVQKVLGDNPFVGGMGIKGIIQVNTDKFPGGGTIYNPEDGWAEILPIKFTTEDGVDIYGDMKTYAVAEGDLDIGTLEIYGGNLKCLKYFYFKENALAYIEKHKKKTLEDYEQMLSDRGNSMITSSGSIYFSVYGWFKSHELKLYYTKLLQLIADDLNDGRYIHIRGNTSYHLSNAYSVNLHCGGDEGCVYFKSKELAEKARAILGDKVKYLFK